MAAEDLTVQQQQFVNALLAGKAKKDAALEAGCLAKSAGVTASKWLKLAKVKAALAKGQAAAGQQALVDGAWVLRRLMQIADLDVAQAFDDKGSLLPVNKMPEEVRRALSGLETFELMEGKGEDRAQIGWVRKVRWWDKVKALELLGKHLGMFDDDKPQGGGPNTVIKFYGFNPFTRSAADKPGG